MAELRRFSLVEQAADQIAARITAGEWEIGAKLPAESALAAELGIGRSTVREAVKELRGRGLVEARQGSGVFVIALERSEEWDAILRRADIDDVLEVREAIEVKAAELAAGRRDSRDLSRLKATLKSRADAEGGRSDDKLVDADIEFHRAIVRAAHNPVLSELFESFAPRIRAAMLDMLGMSPDDRHRHDQDAHSQIMEAIRQRDPVRAAAVMLGQLESDRRGNEQAATPAD
ncbi:FadR/GntR family transcriptional regulator [Mycolicibacterium brisbanense]|uniref:Putative GntR family transcriptional regulator n=1 Tax=Mycolicibacterium brisbanense TaxID=146020 RepID=A0A100W5B2_9MYCO|nr:FadR/GntR family transcriptional regulator [Mycolicibacterium brisbanense]MCV7156035.1 FadR family transcriptional regulator [Mycolicibacterium brisbanense]GAS91884.1 putative GntR family transcriptional regulator [Mycolicibacterium brisbanense]